MQGLWRVRGLCRDRSPNNNNQTEKEREDDMETVLLEIVVGV